MKSKNHIPEKTLLATIDYIANSFAEPARSTILLNCKKHLNELKQIIQNIHEDRCTKILDVGGGMGINLLCLKKIFGQRVDATLIDKFDEYTDSSCMGPKQNGIKIMKKAGINVIAQDLDKSKKLPFGPGQFDIVTMLDVIEHFNHHPLHEFNEAKRVLKKNGAFIVGVPNSASIFRRLDLFFYGKNNTIPLDLWILDKYHSHIKEYSRCDICKLLKIVGFINISIDMNFPHLPSTIKRLFYERHPKQFIFHSLMLVLVQFFPKLRTDILAMGRKH